MRRKMTRRALLRAGLGLASVAPVSALLAGCSGGGSATTSTKTDAINYALPANFTPNWILPIGTASHLNTNNGSISSTSKRRRERYSASSPSAEPIDIDTPCIATG